MRSLLARSLMAALTVGVLAVSHQATAQTGALLYGNDALSGRNLLLGGTVSSSTATTSHESLAQGFTVGDTPYQIQSVDLGLFLSTSMPSLKVSLYSSVGTSGDEVPNVRLGDFDTSAPANENGVFTPNGIKVYNFAFAGEPVVLDANTNYWIVVSYNTQNGVVPPVFNWHFADSGPTGGFDDEAVPGEQNASGVKYLGTLGTHDAGGAWLDHRLGTAFPHAGLRIGVYGTEAVIDNGGGGGIVLTPPTLGCYAYSKGYFKNKYPSGWPASVIANGGAVIGTQVYTIPQLRTMLDTNSTRGNQIGQLSSQLVAVYLSRALAIQTAGDQYLWWDGWAPESTEAQAAFDQAAVLINASAGFDRRGKLTGCITGASNLISALDGYIASHHCAETSNGGGRCNDDDDDDDDRRHGGKYRGKCQGKDKQGRKCVGGR